MGGQHGFDAFRWATGHARRLLIPEKTVRGGTSEIETWLAAFDRVVTGAAGAGAGLGLFRHSASSAVVMKLQEVALVSRAASLRPAS